MTDPVTHHGEGACWSSLWNGLRWVDMYRGDILSLPEGQDNPTRVHVGPIATSIRPRLNGGSIVSLDRTICLFDDGFKLDNTTSDLLGRPFRFNDGGCDPNGDFYCGSMRLDEAGGQSGLYRYDGAKLSASLSGVGISNGIDWSPDGAFAFYVDTHTRRIDRLYFDAEGKVATRDTFVSVEDTEGWPDGLVADAQGGVWVALWGGSEVRYYDSGGKLEQRVTLPATNVTSCALGGSDGRTLFVTTSRQGIEPGTEPLAGSLFALKSDTPGQTTRPFRG